MNHCGTLPIRTARLLLRPFAASDAPAAFRNWTADESVTRFLRWPAHESVSVTQSVLQSWIDCYADPSFYQWAIVPEGLGEPIGSISAVDHDDRTRKIHIGYCIGRTWWSQGYASEALEAVIRFFFEKVDAQRVESQHNPNNPASGRVMQKCGMRYEGTLRKADWSNQGIVDACMYSILRSEYEKTRR